MLTLITFKGIRQKSMKKIVKTKSGESINTLFIEWFLEVWHYAFSYDKD